MLGFSINFFFVVEVFDIFITESVIQMALYLNCLTKIDNFFSAVFKKVKGKNKIETSDFEVFFN